MAVDEYSLQRQRMLADQIVRRGVQDPRLLRAMQKVPRHRFVLPEDLAWAYADGPLPIGHGQTISQPYIVALMTSLLDPDKTARLLEIGTGSGYQAAVLGELAQEVHTIELIPELAERAGRTLGDLGCANVHVHLGDGSMGWQDCAPYDGILVSAAGPRVPPPLLEQLADGGRLVLPVGAHGFQWLEVHQRQGERFTRAENIPVAFVPLRGKYGWK